MQVPVERRARHPELFGDLGHRVALVVEPSGLGGGVLVEPRRATPAPARGTARSPARRGCCSRPGCAGGRPARRARRAVPRPTTSGCRGPRRGSAARRRRRAAAARSATRCRTDDASRSSPVTTRTSPGVRSASTASSSGRGRACPVRAVDPDRREAPRRRHCSRSIWPSDPRRCGATLAYPRNTCPPCRQPMSRPRPVHRAPTTPRNHRWNVTPTTPMGHTRCVGKGVPSAAGSISAGGRSERRPCW